MKQILNMISLPDIAALGLLLGTAAKLIPAVAGVLAVIYYGFVIYDRVRYGPELERRMLWHAKQKKGNENETSNTKLLTEDPGI